MGSHSIQTAVSINILGRVWRIKQDVTPKMLHVFLKSQNVIHCQDKTGRSFMAEFFKNYRNNKFYSAPEIILPVLTSWYSWYLHRWADSTTLVWSLMMSSRFILHNKLFLIQKCDVYSAGFLFRLENAIQLVRLFHQAHPDSPSSKYVASYHMTGFDELWVSLVSHVKTKQQYLGGDTSPEVWKKKKTTRAILS